MPDLSDYPFEIRPLTAAEGGGFLIAYPDFAACSADGETVAGGGVPGPGPSAGPSPFKG